MPSNIRVTSTDFWMATTVAIAMDLVLLGVLVWQVRPSSCRHLGPVLTIVSGILWGGFGCVLVWVFWDLYYRYLFPDWVRWVIPLNAILYGAIGLGLWWLSGKPRGGRVLAFCMLGGLAGVLEHLLGISWLGVLEKVPFLKGVDPQPLLVFAFFEYVLYWGIVLGAAVLVERTGLFRRTPPYPRTKPG